MSDTSKTTSKTPKSPTVQKSLETTMLRQARNQLLAFNLVVMAVVVIAAFVVIYQMQSANLSAAQSQIVEIMSAAFSEEQGTAENVSTTSDDVVAAQNVPHDISASFSGSGSVTIESSGENGEISTYYAIAGTADQQVTSQALSSMLIGLSMIGIVLLGLIALASYFFANRAMRPLAQAITQQQRFVADASHEFRTPLAVIRAHTDVLRASPQATVASQMEWVNHISKETDSLARLTEDLLLLANGSARQPVPEPLDLSALVRDQLTNIETLAFERDVSLETNLPEPLLITTDPALLRRLITILLENALKYVDPNGSIAVSTAPGSLIVSNSGLGIPADDLPHIFERFYRVDSSRTTEDENCIDDVESGLGAKHPSGFGLGLSVAQDIATQLGAKLTAKSIPGELTTFTLTFH